MNDVVATGRPASVLTLIIMLALVSGTPAGQPSCLGQQDAPADNASIPRLIPPAGQAPPADVQQRSRTRLQRLQGKASALAASLPPASADGIQASLLADVEILLKAVDLALEHHEFYAKGDADFRKADGLLELAQQRLDSLEERQAPWAKATGLVVRGFYSKIDGSPQPYGLEIPDAIDLSQPAPLLVFLHGRGDKTTDMHFIDQRLKQAGKVGLPGAIVLHPFGRQCIGFKSAGEIDVLEAIEDVSRRYRIDANRVVMMGFSMGGAGAWHLGAHYADRWVAVSPGAGFAETARYNRLQPKDYPPAYEQTLWGAYDVPDYVRNLFNTTVIAYSGELDKQIQAARVMEQAYQSEGRELRHLIGPGVAHQYEPATLRKLLDQLQQAVEQGRATAPREVHLQTRTLRYPKMHWVEALRLGRHWQDARVDAALRDQQWQVTTRNVARLRLHPPLAADALLVDGQTVVRDYQPREILLERGDDSWREVQAGDKAPLHKRPGLQGPIDDAFMGAFLVVAPVGPCQHPAVDRWVRAELDHLRSRWKALFRATLPEKAASEVTLDDARQKNLILWGDAASNPWIARLLTADPAVAPPLRWNENEVVLGQQRADAEKHAPVLIFPSPWNDNGAATARYVVLNSGPTFREAHDRTNSLQNPKLPDWAILRIDTPPDERRAGEVWAAGFFDEFWGLTLPQD